MRPQFAVGRLSTLQGSFRPRLASR